MPTSEISSPLITERLRGEEGEQSQKLDSEDDSDKPFSLDSEQMKLVSGQTENDEMLAKEQEEAEASEDEYASGNIYIELPAPTLPWPPVVKVIPPSPKPRPIGPARGSVPEERSPLVESPHHKKSTEASVLPVTRHPKQSGHEQQDNPDYSLYEQVDWTTPVSIIIQNPLKCSFTLFTQAVEREKLAPCSSKMKTSASFPQLAEREIHGEENIYESIYLGHETQPSALSFHPASERKATCNVLDDEVEEDVYVDPPEFSPGSLKIPAVTIAPPSPKPRRRTEPSQELKHLSEKARALQEVRQVQDKPKRPQLQPPTPTNRRGSPAIPRSHPNLTQVHSLPIDSKQDDSDTHVYEPVQPENLHIPPKEAPNATITTPSNLPHKALYFNLPPPNKKGSEASKVTPPVRPKPRSLRPSSPIAKHLQHSPTEENVPSPKPRPRNLPQPPSPVTHSPTETCSPVTSTELHNLLYSVPGTDDGIYEVVDTAEPVPVPVPRQPPIPPPRTKKFTCELTMKNLCQNIFHCT